jgi:Flp pilus assembly protein TadG
MRKHERGQALVELAIAGPVFILLVLGILQIGLGISYWHDMNRMANQGARWATQNTWPDCPTTAATCTTNPSCTAANQANRTLQNYIRCEARSTGLRGSLANPVICYPSGSNLLGEPVRVRVATTFYLAPIVDAIPIRLTADATMRLETSPTKITGVVSPCP